MFELVEAARHDVPLTYFEFGTLAALVYFSHMDCDAWVLEVGLGGRLDAVNLVDADFSVVTTVDLDHQQWLGDSIDAIAAEKAGIIKAESTAFYGDQPVPPPIRTQARRLKAPLICLNEQYSYTQQDSSWSWQGIATQLDDIPLPPGGGAEQLRNISLGLAVIEHYNADLLERTPLRAIIEKLQLPGRFQIVQREVEWVLDVAHNRQAARALRDKLRLLPARGGPTTVVVGMLADKQASEFAAQLADIADQWIACPTGGNRGAAANDLATRIGMTAAHPVRIAESVEEGLELACEITPENGRIVVCGSFLVVGPALEWLGLY
jgi:dihydrofolate synthase/folylpolyglutamate synthase